MINTQLRGPKRAGIRRRRAISGHKEKSCQSVGRENSSRDTESGVSPCEEEGEEAVRDTGDEGQGQCYRQAVPPVGHNKH